MYKDEQISFSRILFSTPKCNPIMLSVLLVKSLKFHWALMEVFALILPIYSTHKKANIPKKSYN